MSKPRIVERPILCGHPDCRVPYSLQAVPFKVGMVVHDCNLAFGRLAGILLGD